MDLRAHDILSQHIPGADGWAEHHALFGGFGLDPIKRDVVRQQVQCLRQSQPAREIGFVERDRILAGDQPDLFRLGKGIPGGVRGGARLPGGYRCPVQ